MIQFLIFAGEEIKKMWEDVYNDCKLYYDQEKILKSGSGAIPGPSNRKYPTDIYEKMRFIQKYTYNPDGDICSTRNNNIQKKNIWELEREESDTKTRKPKVPKLDAFAANKVNEKEKLTNLLERLVNKIEDVADKRTSLENNNQNIVSNDQSPHDDNKDFYVRKLDKMFRQMDSKRRDTCFDVLFDEVQKFYLSSLILKIFI